MPRDASWQNAWAEIGSYNFRSRGIGPVARGVNPFRMNYGRMAPPNMFYHRANPRFPYIPMRNRQYMARTIPAPRQNFVPHPIYPQMRRPYIETPRLRTPGFKRTGPLPRVVTRPKQVQHHHQQPVFNHLPAKIRPHPSIEQKMMHKARKHAKAKAVFRTVPKAKSFSGLLAKTALGSQLGG